MRFSADREGRQLEEIQRFFELSLTELGNLFGTSRQAVSTWFVNGVPADRKPKINTVLKTAEFLQRQLKPGRLPAVARRRASACGGLSILEMIGADRHEALLERIRESFNWADHVAAGDGPASATASTSPAIRPDATRSTKA